MATEQELQSFLAEPRENLDAEYKSWLDLTTNDHKATLAKACIALANHGCGYIIIGFEDNETQLVPVQRSANIPEISQDAVNSAIQRYAAPSFHAEVYRVSHPESGEIHPVIVVPRDITEPVMSKRDCENVIVKNRCYIRKPGPRSEEPKTGEEWRVLLQRCIRASRDDMLEAIRSIVSGRIEQAELPVDERDELQAFLLQARTHWEELCGQLPADAAARFPRGYYEMAFSLLGSRPAQNITELRGRMQAAHSLQHTGWPAFIMLNTPDWTPYIYDDFLEAWVGRPSEREVYINDPAHGDFWRASVAGKLYTIRGYAEDGFDGVQPGTVIDITLPIWRVAEGLLFAGRLSENFPDVDAIAVECRFTGLNNRVLSSLDGSRAVFNDRICRTQEVVLRGQVRVDQLWDNLSEFMHQLLVPLYERFDFFPLSRELVDTELARMRRGRF